MLAQKAAPEELQGLLVSLCRGADPERTGKIPIASMREIIRSANLGARFRKQNAFVFVETGVSRFGMHLSAISAARSFAGRCRADAGADPFGTF